MSHEKHSVSIWRKPSWRSLKHLDTDQESVLVQLLRAVQSRRVKRTPARHGPRASHQSQGKIEHANRVINGVCRAGLSFENLLQEKLASDSILIAWLVRHAAWSLTRFQVKDAGRTAFARVFWGSIHEPSLAIWRKSDVQVHGRADRQNLDQRWVHGLVMCQ